MLLTRDRDAPRNKSFFISSRFLRALAAPVPHILVFLAGGGIPSLFRLVFLALSSAVCRLSTWTPAPCRPAEREPAKRRTCVTFAGARLSLLLST
ncbi:hypothetical protein GOODEAATRI_007141 [Goodea atripinnis]|uniref:Transmembrane protein n=1 Tax=Goodea atripinnis TaxID=208336 RepID=A0ABV0NTL6_9TELE